MATIKPVRIIQPGWGSSGFYPAAVLERDGPAAFPVGTHMYLDHQTREERLAKPERSLRRLGAVIETTPVYQEEGPIGPGLYATVSIFDDVADGLVERAPHIGLSIVAQGEVEPGEREGRRGPIIQSLISGDSVDFVTRPGAGGAILIESASEDSADTLIEPAVLVENESMAAFIINAMHGSTTSRINHAHERGIIDFATRQALHQALLEAVAAFWLAMDDIGIGDPPTTVVGESGRLHVQREETLPMSEPNGNGVGTTDATLKETMARVAILEAQNAKSARAMHVLSARLVIKEALEADKYQRLPALAKTLIERANQPEGETDLVALVEAVVADADAMLTSIPTGPSGQVQGQGQSTAGPLVEADVMKEAVGLMVAQGYTEEQALAAVGGVA